MKKRFLIYGLLLGCIAVQAAPEGFTALFNGKDLSGWWGLGTEDPADWLTLSPDELRLKKESSLSNIHAHWSVNDGVLVNDGHGLFLTTEHNYADFELLLEYKTVAKADSGIYLRGIPQVQIWDSTEKAKFKLGADKGSGGLWNNHWSAKGRDPLVLADKPFGEWNQLRILMVGEYVTVHLNDHLVVDHARLQNYFSRNDTLQRPVPRAGPIQLQTHGGEISWRNIYLREIGGTEANALLASRILQDGHQPEEWMGAVDRHRFEDGVITPIGKGGHLFTKVQYGDFAVKLEFKLPPGGNNGLAIRYPGHGNPAYDGMCELQVLDNTAVKYNTLDDRQYHGSAYGMVPAHRGYLRPVGEWNFQYVKVVDSTLLVELNGSRILETDLSTVHDYLQNKKHPGKGLKRGHFGFAGHNSPVIYRHIFIKELQDDEK